MQYLKPTDKIHKITLDSRIIHALWERRIASAGAEVRLEVLTQFVGNNSDIKIKVKDKKGKTIAKLDGKVYANKFNASIFIPEKAKEELSYTAKLPKHGLEMESGKLKVIPPIKVMNLKWGQKEARRGDIVKLTADIKGISDETEVMINIYEYDQDNAHDFITKFPARVKKNKIETEWEYEYHEDVDDIPTDEEMRRYGTGYNPPEYFFMIDLYGQRFGGKQESGLLEFKDWIEIRSYNYSGKEKYILHLADGTKREGRFDDKGVGREEDVPPGKCSFEIVTEGNSIGVPGKTGQCYFFINYKRAIILYPSLLTPAVLPGDDDLEIMLLVRQGEELTRADVNVQLKIVPWQESMTGSGIYRYWVPMKSKIPELKGAKTTYSYLDSVSSYVGKPFIENFLFDNSCLSNIKKVKKVGVIKPDTLEVIQTDSKFSGIIEKRALRFYHEANYTDIYKVRIAGIGQKLNQDISMYNNNQDISMYNMFWFYAPTLPKGSVVIEEDGIMKGTDHVERWRNHGELQDGIISRHLKKINGKSIQKYQGRYYCFNVSNESNDVDIATINEKAPIQAYHPLFYYKKSTHFNIGHITDLHISSRQSLLNKSPARVIECDIDDSENISPEIGGMMNVCSKNIKSLFDKMGADKQTDMILITGDLIDYVKNYYSAEKYSEASKSVSKIWEKIAVDGEGYKDNYQDYVDFIIIYSLIIYFYDKYKKPVFVVNGNHDAYYESYGISPRTVGTKANPGIPADHNLTIYEAILAFGKTYATINKTMPLALGLFEPYYFKWFHYILTPFSDFCIHLPKQILVGLGWGDQEDKFLDSQGILGHLPRSDEAISDKQMQVIDKAVKYNTDNSSNRKKVILMSHFTFVSYQDSIPVGVKSPGVKSPIQGWISADPGRLSKEGKHDWGTFELNRDKMYCDYLHDRRVIDYIVTGHSHRRGAYLITGKTTVWELKSEPFSLIASLLIASLPFREARYVKTEGYDFESFNSLKEEKLKKEGSPVIIVSDSAGPIPRYNKSNIFDGWGSVRPSGSKIRFDASGGIAQIVNIDVEHSTSLPRIAVAMDYMERIKGNDLISSFRSNEIEYSGISQDLSFTLVLNEKFSSFFYCEKLILFLWTRNKRKSKGDWKRIDFTLENGKWKIKKSSSDLDDFINLPSKHTQIPQKKAFLSLKLNAYNSSLRNQYDFKSHWNYECKLERDEIIFPSKLNAYNSSLRNQYDFNSHYECKPERDTIIFFSSKATYSIVRNKDRAEIPDFEFRKSLGGKYD